MLTDIFNGIYNQQIDPKKARNVIIGFFVIVFVTSISISTINYFDKDVIKKKKLKKPEVKKEDKKPEIKVQKKRKERSSRKKTS